MRKPLSLLLFLLSAAFAFAQSDLPGDYSAEMIFTQGEGRVHIGDNEKVDIVFGDSTLHADYLSLQGGKYIELIVDGTNKMDFRVLREGDTISLFLLPDSNPEMLASLTKEMNIPEDSNGLTKEFGAKFREKLIELFDEVPALRLRRQ